MTKRLILSCLVIVCLIGLILYSKWNPAPQRASGMIEADEIRLGSRVGGRVAAVYVQEGQQVEQGTLLVELEPYDLKEREQELQRSLAAWEAEYQRLVTGFREEEKGQAKAKLDQLQARLELLQAGPRVEEIDAARARLDQSEAEQRRATQDYERVSKLAETNATSQQELDLARQVLEASAAMVTVRKEELEVLELGTREEELREAAARVDEAYQAWQLTLHGYRPEEIEKAKASRDAARARLDAIRQQLEELKIVSPVTGTVEALDLQVGDMVAAGAPVLSVLDRSHLWVRTYVPQTIAGIQVGTMIPLTVDAYPDEQLQGKVTFISRQAEFTPSNVQTPEERSKLVYRAKIAVQDPEDRLRPGMLVDVWLDHLGKAEKGSP